MCEGDLLAGQVYPGIDRCLDNAALIHKVPQGSSGSTEIYLECLIDGVDIPHICGGHWIALLWSYGSPCAILGPEVDDFLHRAISDTIIRQVPYYPRQLDCFLVHCCWCLWLLAW